jgi:hypothetical protein
MEKKKRLWLIDAGYLFNARHCVYDGYEFSYLKLRKKLEEFGPIWRGYYFNSESSPTLDRVSSFHSWLRTAPPEGPGLITKLYSLKRQRADKAFCEKCGQKVPLSCPNQNESDDKHWLVNEIQKGVDVGLATLALILKDHYDTLILSSGDADLLDAIEHLGEIGHEIQLAVFSDGVSTELQCRADRIFWLNDIATEIAQPTKNIPSITPVRIKKGI